jgi:hypothetical protein
MEKNKEVLLNEGSAHLHVLIGDFEKNENKVVVKGLTILRHETPTGKFAEHQTLLLEEGKWVLARQVEFNPFDRTVTQIWD